MRQKLFLIGLAVLMLAALPAVAEESAQDALHGPAADAEAPAAAPEAAAEAEAEAAADDSEEMPSFFAATTVTATGSEVDVFKISTPVTVIPTQEIERRLPDNAVDLLRDQPGVDVNGVGPNQQRPIIRGQRGLRVLFLENGLRLNNARRQTDFGEISGLVDMDNVESVEVVRGPASVLYGTDAIGGVLNLVTKVPSYRDGSWFGGSAGVRYGTAGDQTRGQAAIEGRSGKVSFNLGASVRESDDYEAAAGSFGAIRLDREVRVVDTGLDDESVYGYLGYDLSDRHQVTLRYNRYRADQAGFGFVEPEELGGEEDFRIRILYPFQDFDRYTLGYIGSVLDLPVADTVDAQLYYQTNERQLANDIDINIGPLFPGAPDSTVEADTLNFTELDTFGGRAEVIKGFADRHLVTYGVEFFEDDSFNTDFSTTTATLRFPFPPFQIVSVGTDDVANAPNATNSSYGVFVQDEILALERLKITVGARYQSVSTRAEATPGWDVSGLDFDDDTVVGSANLIYELTGNLKLVGSYGTAFRAPNIVERLFNGPTPEGAGFQVLNPDLTSEESTNYDIGLKYRRPNAVFELIYFRNDIDDGIIQYFLSPAERLLLPQDVQDAIEASGIDFVVQQRNIDRLRYEGVETIVGYRMDNGLSMGGNYTYLDGKRLDSTNPPTGDTLSDKLNAWLRYDPASGRYWAEYRLRHNGSDKANLDPNEPTPPVGRTLPSFTVHQLSGGVTFGADDGIRHSLALLLDNLTDELYAEFSNATFFRPQPGRRAVATYRIHF